MAGLFSTLSRKAPQLIRNTLPLISNSANILRHSSACAGAPKVQEAAPDFKGTAVIGDEFKQIQLSDYKGKYVVLCFYPLDFTFVCPTELIALDDKFEQFQERNTQVIGCSIDSHFSHLAWTKSNRKEGGLGKLRYPLLSDIHKKIARDYGVLIESEGVALRGSFIIDGNGILRQMSINDLPIGRSVDETLRLIDALKFHEDNGEVCPANWKKGGKTIKPTPKESKEYFESANK